jgi:hypothetical protein
MTNDRITVKFVASGRGKARCPANPDFPYGKAIDLTNGKPGVWIDLPYPAPECGSFVISGARIKSGAVTAAGRADDPTKIKLPYVENVRG